MRLIDADAYSKKVCTYNETGCGSCAVQMTCPFDEPTVDAIPIAIIQREIDNWDRKKPQSFHAIAYRHLIEDWRREQDILETTRNYLKRGDDDETD